MINRHCFPWLHGRLKTFLFEYRKNPPIVELHIAAWAAMQSNVTCDKLNLLLRVQELEIDYCILLSPIFYSWMWLRSVYLFQKFWLWYGLVNAEKSLMTCMELIKRTCSFCMFSWRCSPAHVGAAWPARVCSLAWKPCSPSNRLSLIPTDAEWGEVTSGLENQVSVGEFHPQPAHSRTSSQECRLLFGARSIFNRQII